MKERGLRSPGGSEFRLRNSGFFTTPCALVGGRRPLWIGNHRVRAVPLGSVLYEDDIVRCGDVTLYGMTADIVVDLRDWILGTDRRRVAARVEGLRSFMELRRAE